MDTDILEQPAAFIFRL